MLVGVIGAGAAERPTARQVIERIQKNVGVPWQTPTVDTFKAGNPDTPVTCIVTTFMATEDVLERSVAAGCNFVITHEPTFYNHEDRTEQFAGDPVYAAKQDYIAKHGLVVFRFHDHWHMRRPDGIQEGMIAALGWDHFRNPQDPSLFTVPHTTLAGLAAAIAGKLQIRALRYVGDPAMPVTKIALLPGAAGEMSHIKALERDDVEVLVAGEAREWETVPWVQDAVAQGRHKALILMGHVVSEEAGMDECARWLRTFITEVPIRFLPAGEPFHTVR